MIGAVVDAVVVVGLISCQINTPSFVEFVKVFGQFQALLPKRLALQLLNGRRRDVTMPEQSQGRVVLLHGAGGGIKNLAIVEQQVHGGLRRRG